MKWIRTDNPRVFETVNGTCYAFAEDSPFAEQGYIARIYEKPLQMAMFSDAPAEQVPGTAQWGLEMGSALRMCVKRYDPEAELPEREKVLP